MQFIHDEIHDSIASPHHGIAYGTFEHKLKYNKKSKLRLIKTVFSFSLLEPRGGFHIHEYS